MAPRPLRVLIPNDDGVSAPGIRWLALAARSRGADVTVAAPLQEASGTGAALSAVLEDGRVVFNRTVPADLPGVPVFGVAASPAYITILASLGVFGPPPDVLLSGINRGANAGHAVLHSGTVGAALTAANHGIRAMAVSLDVLYPTAVSGDAASGGAALAALDAVDDATRNWASAADVAGGLLDWVADSPDVTVLNVNVPDVPAAELRGMRQATLAAFGQVQMAVAETGSDYVRTSVEAHGARLVPGTDIALLADGHATVTVLQPVGHRTDIAVPTALPRTTPAR